jgi:cation transport protein ChaC
MDSGVNKSPPVQGTLLSKEDFASGRHVEMIAEMGLLDHVDLHTEEYRMARKEEMIAASPPDADTIWVFGYGSLIWNPAFDYDERRIGVLHGYHRQFCFWSTIGRGTPDRPGMMLALDRGGSCKGVVLGVRRDRASEELTSVFMRELTGRTYHPRLLRVTTAEGAVSAITFVADRESRNYAGRRSPEETARHIAQGCGHLGPCRDYLFNTTEHLDALGIHDRRLHELCRLVRDIPEPSG